MAEEGGGGHGDSGSSSAIGSAQRLPPPPPPQAPQPGSQAPPAPALAPDQLPQNNTLVALPIVAIENILSFMSYDEISQLRLVRPPRDPRRPLRRADVWEGAGWEPPASPAGAGARARPSRPQVSLRAPVSGFVPMPPSPRGGTTVGATSPWGAPRLEARREWGSHLRPAGARTPEWAWRPRGQNSRGGSVIPGRSQLWIICQQNVLFPSRPGFLVEKVGLVGPPQTRPRPGAGAGARRRPGRCSRRSPGPAPRPAAARPSAPTRPLTRVFLPRGSFSN